jgi:hypothetical protein
MRLDHKPRWSAVEHVNRARAARPASGGKVYKQGRVASYRPQPKKGTWEYLMGRVEAGWRYDCDEAILNYRRAVFPEQYPEVEEFI